MEQILFSIEDVAKLIGGISELTLFNLAKKMEIKSLLNREENEFLGFRNKIVLPQILKEKCFTEEDIARLLIGLKIENNVTKKLEGDIEILNNKIKNKENMLKEIINRISQAEEELYVEKIRKDEKILQLNNEIKDEEKKVQTLKDKIKEEEKK